ncbi:MAG: TIGR01777 family oxidoreductase [Candidatus Omnitrophota bacterium]
MKVVICGASGLIGKPLSAAILAKGWELVRLVRKKGPAISGAREREIWWWPPTLGDWMKEIDGAHAVINLSGEPIAGRRWTETQKKELRASRLHATRAIVEAISQVKNKPKVLLNASAVGFYGPRDGSVIDESAVAGPDFLSGLCQEWEKEARKADAFGVRTVNLRTGIVLSTEGGALAKMLPPFKAFLGGPLGNGRQFLSWIHIEDEVGAILKALEDPSLRGPVNLTAPHAVPMREFARTLGRVLGRPAVFPVPGFVLKLLLGEMSTLLLTGQNVFPRKLAEAGFQFRYPFLETALQALLRKA